MFSGLCCDELFHSLPAAFWTAGMLSFSLPWGEGKNGKNKIGSLFNGFFARITAAVLLTTLCGSVSSVAEAVKVDNRAYSISPISKLNSFDISRSDSGTLLVAGEHGIVLRSKDGISWQSIQTSVSRALTAVQSLGNEVWLAIGWDGLIIKSDDDGFTWRTVYSKQSNGLGLPLVLLSVYFLDSSHGFALGSAGTLLSSTDAGETWKETILVDRDGIEVHLYGMTLIGRYLYLAGEKGTLFRAELGHTGLHSSWTLLPFPYHGSLFGLQGLSNGDLVVYGMLGRVFKSSDQAATWTDCTVVDGTSWMSMASLSEKEVVLVGLKAQVRVVDIGICDGTSKEFFPIVSKALGGRGSQIYC